MGHLIVFFFIARMASQPRHDHEDAPFIYSTMVDKYLEENKDTAFKSQVLHEDIGSSERMEQDEAKGSGLLEAEQLSHVYGCTRLTDIVFASSAIIARLNAVTTKKEAVSALVSYYSTKTYVLLEEYMNELDSRAKGRKVYQMDDRIDPLEGEINDMLLKIEKTPIHTREWIDLADRIDFALIKLFSLVKSHPRIPNSGGVHHYTL